ncbi:MAG: adenylate/guanylate cyclase domain-containing protein [SAR324 cluster bacterium]|nr:adenylate/guanylate cyclase domain-containing protein [SAR324 cluster bacterium]
MEDPSPRRKLAVILVTDVVGFSSMMEENEDQTLKNLKACRKIIDGLVDEHHGSIFNTAGDSVLAEFQSAVEAVICGSEFQNTIKERNNSIPEEEQMEFRIGINMGDVVIEGDNLYGEGVNVAARLEALAQPGGVCLSKNVYDMIHKKTNFLFHDLGEQTVKNTILHAVDVTLDGTSQRKLPESTPEKKSSTEKPPAIAILPFANMSGDSEQEYFADGITEDIITNLSLWKTFPVISRNSSFTFKGKSANLKEVSSELGVRYVVEGSVRKGGNKVRITAQLIDAETDHHLWSEKWDRSLDDIFEVQDEVSASIAAKVAPSLSGYEQNRLERNRPSNLSAWEEYLKGLRYLNDRGRTDKNDPNLTKAKQQFSKANEMDPLFSETYALLALCELLELAQFISKDREKTINSIYTYSQKALSLDSENSLALNMLSAFYSFKEKYDMGMDYAEQCVRCNPSYPLNHLRLGLTQNMLGVFEKSDESFLTAIKLSPLDPELHLFYTGLCFSYIGQKKFDKALEACDKAMNLVSNMGRLYGFKAAILGFSGRLDEAKIELNKYLEARPNLKTKDDFRKLFFRSSPLTDIVIEGLCMAGWEPEES